MSASPFGPDERVMLKQISEENERIERAWQHFDSLMRSSPGGVRLEREAFYAACRWLLRESVT